MTAPSWHQRPVTTLAFLWRIERGDGVAIGFTSHDRDLIRDDFVYRAAPGMMPSAVRLTDGFDADDVELDGAIASGALTEADLRAGRWDGAQLTLSAVDWQDAGAVPVRLIRGSFGSVSLKDGAFSVTLRGAARVLDKPVSEETSPACRATLGDRRCRVDLRGRRARRMASVSGSAVTLDVAVTEGAFAWGSLKWIDGPRAGMIDRVLANSASAVTLAERIAHSGTHAVELREGCDRQFATCHDRFANVLNFQGEPHLPGNDLLTRYA